MDCYPEQRRIRLQMNAPMFEKAILAWKDGDLDGARGRFQQIMEDDPDDHVAYIYHQRCLNNERWEDEGVIGRTVMSMLRRSTD